MTSRRTPLLRATAVALGLAAVSAAALPGVGAPATAATTSTSTTVAAPGAGNDARVTVTKTDNLVNEAVTVSWQGFRPSSASRLSNSNDSYDVTTQGPVRVYQCRGDDPASSSECYGSPGFGGVAATAESPAVPPVPSFTYPGKGDSTNANPDGPSNWQDTVTAADGTGEATIQLFTRRESAALGCADDTPCSLVVVPNYGADDGSGATELSMDAPWAWARRTVIPLHFLPLDASCPLDGKSVDIEGSPVAARLMASWRARTCTLATGAVRLDYTSIGETQTRSDTVAAANDAGLVIESADKDEAAGVPLVYAPVAATSLVVAYQIDDAEGRPVRSLRLNARLVAKLITASYRTGGNAAVAGNPFNLFHDPEFLKLNPGVAWPDGSPGTRVLLLGDLSDTTRALTRWIQADHDARAFLDGTPDPWGMHVNTHYRRVHLPFDAFPVLDQAQSDFFEPIQGLDEVARKLSIAQFPGATTTYEGGVAVVTKPPRQNPGSREVIGIVDAASASDFRLSTAQLQNAGGAFVGPDAHGVLAGIEHSVVGPDKVTRYVDQASHDRSIYPLSLLVSAVASLKADKDIRSSVSTFLDYAAGAGQVPGDEIGRLPGGYVPLPSALVGQIRTAQKSLAKGAPPAKAPKDTADAGEPPAVAPAAAPPDGVAPVETPPVAASPSDVDLMASTITVRPQPLYRRVLTLPFVLALGLLAGLVGPSVTILRRTKRGPAWLRH